MTINIEKVVLSRKGFDSMAGGDYSRVDPVTGKYILIPIPEDPIPKPEDSTKFYKYKDIRVTPNYLSSECIAANLKDLINTKPMKMNKSARISSEKFVHFDPWLGCCRWLEVDDESACAIGAFGQQGSPLGHLRNQKVLEDIDKGRLFLFFSRFKLLEPYNNKDKINPGSGEAYFIYGWLKVAAIIKNINDIDIITRNKLEAIRHPHLCYLKEGENVIFLGAEWLDEEHTIPGYGYFRELNEKLMLSKLGPNPNVWCLPEFFGRENGKRLTYLANKKWNIEDGKAIMRELKGNGQEFVFDVSEVKEEFNEWINTLMLEAAMSG